MINRNCHRLYISLLLVFSAVLIMPIDSRAEMTYYLGGKQVSILTYRSVMAQNDAVALMKQNRTREAIAKLRTAVSYDPSLAEIHSLLGVALSRAGKIDEAVEQFKTALELDDRIVTARLNLASLYQSSGQLSDALEAYKQFARDFPDSKPDAVKDRIDIIEKELKREGEAQKNYREDSRSYLNNVTVQGKRRWPASVMPLKVYIRDGDGLSDYRPEYDKILRQSFSEWQNASHGKVQFAYVSNPADADITCTWIDDPELLQSSAEGGETDVRTLASTVLKSKVLLSLKDDGTFPLTSNLIRVLALHEIGHALGLLGHSATPGDVMYCTAPVVDVEKHLSDRDVNTLAELYRQDVDPLSQALSTLNRETHGNVQGAIRVICIAITAIACTGIILAVILGKLRPKKKKSRSTKA